MLKLGKFSVAIALGLMMSMLLFAPAAFAQSANHNTTSKVAQVAVSTNALQQTNTVVQLSSVQQTGWGYGGGWHARHFRFFRPFRPFRSFVVIYRPYGFGAYGCRGW